MIDEVTGPKNDFYIKLPNEAAMLTVLSAFYNEEGELVTNTADYSIDVVGVLHEATGVTLTDASGMDYPELVVIPGWHLNIRLLNDNLRSDADGIAISNEVTPTNPLRVWL
jgi:hypothetical protein|tara:strand:+ start:412 stop:744 length:333 start_codon:yes stop_codon:yes gene_type:complete